LRTLPSPVRGHRQNQFRRSAPLPLPCPGQDLIELVRPAGDMLKRCLICSRVAEDKGNKGLFFSDDTLAECLCCPCQGNAGRHHIKTNPLTYIDELQDIETVHDAEHGAYGKDQFMVVGDLAVYIAVLLLETLPHKADMDAAHGAACAGRVPQECYSANFSPLMPSAAGSVVACRFLIGNAFRSFITLTFPGVPRLWYLDIMSVSVMSL